jgi:hypothetical protein
MVFFSPLNACFLLLTTHVHNLAMCISHSNFLIGCYIWSEFFISSTHHSQGTSVISWFVVDDNSFVLDLLCYHWLSFCNHESSLHKVITWFLLIVCFCFFFGFSFTFNGWIPVLDFYLQGFPSEKALPYKPKQSQKEKEKGKERTWDGFQFIHPLEVHILTSPPIASLENSEGYLIDCALFHRFEGPLGCGPWLRSRLGSECALPGTPDCDLRARAAAFFAVASSVEDKNCARAFSLSLVWQCRSSGIVFFFFWFSSCSWCKMRWEGINFSEPFALLFSLAIYVSSCKMELFWPRTPSPSSGLLPHFGVTYLLRRRLDFFLQREWQSNRFSSS